MPGLPLPAPIPREHWTICRYFHSMSQGQGRSLPLSRRNAGNEGASVCAVECKRSTNPWLWLRGWGGMGRWPRQQSRFQQCVPVQWQQCLYGGIWDMCRCPRWQADSLQSSKGHQLCEQSLSRDIHEGYVSPFIWQWAKLRYFLLHSSSGGSSALSQG